MTAVIYARYSSDSQREASIEGSCATARTTPRRTVSPWWHLYRPCLLCQNGDRPDFQRMIKDSGKKIFDVVLVWKLDRFARNRYDAVNYKHHW